MNIWDSRPRFLQILDQSPGPVSYRGPLSLETGCLGLCGGEVMLDLLMVIIAVVFFVLSWAYVLGTEKL